MNYLPKLIMQDIKFQFRQGFYLVYGIITTVYILILKLLGSSIASKVSPIIIFSDPTFIGFLFIGAILFFEREQRITQVLFITPIKKIYYVLSKCISLTLVSLLVVIFIIVFTHGFFVNWGYIVLGVLLTSFIFILLGMFISNYVKTITSYIIFGGILMSPFSVSIVHYLGFIESNLFYLIPTTGTLKLINGGINGGLSIFDFIFSVFYLIDITILTLLLVLKTKGADNEDF